MAAVAPTSPRPTRIARSRQVGLEIALPEAEPEYANALAEAIVGLKPDQGEASEAKALSA